MKRKRVTSRDKPRVANPRRTWKTLNETEEKYRPIFEKTPIGTFRSSFEGRLLEVNPGLSNMFGYPSPEVMLREVQDVGKELYSRAEDRRRIITDQLTAVDVTHHVNRYRRRDGGELFANLYLRTVRDANGQPIYLEGIVEDITDLKQLEDGLHRSEERFRSLFDSMLDGIYLSTHEGRFVDVNPAFVKMFGYSSKEEMLRIRDIKKELYFSPEERGSHVLDTGQEEVEVYQMRRKDGSEIWVEDHGRYVHDEQGNVIYHEGILRDVTERKHLEDQLKQYSLNLEKLVDERTAKLRESERRFRHLADLLPQIVFEIDSNGNFTFVNRKGFEVTGYTSKDGANPVNALQLFVPEDRERIMKSTMRVLSGENMPGGEYTLLTKDGRTFPAFVHGTQIVQDGKVVGLRGIAVDITERKRAEENLRQSERRFRELAELLPQMVFETDVNGVFTFVNQLGLASTGYTEEDLRNRVGNFFQLVPPEEYEKVSASIARQKEERPIQIELKVLRKDGSVFPALVYAGAIVCEGKIVGFRGIAVDITERKQMEEAIRESEARYRRLFESSPISLWEEDFSEVKKYFDNLRARGIQDLRAHLTDYPDELAKCAGLVKILDINEATRKLYGVKSTDELHGELQKVLPRNFKKNFREEIVAFWNGDTNFSSEFDNLTVSGEAKHVRVVLTVVPGFEESLERVLAAVVDLTPQRELEKELRSTKDRLEHVLATNPAVLYLEEPLPDLSDTISTFVSESARTILGFEPKLLVGESGLSLWRSRLHPDDLTRYHAELPLLWREGQHTFEYRFLHSDGNYRWISETYRVIRDAEGRVLNAVAVAIDITDRRRLEDKLMRAERLATIGETAAMVAHDLRNPLQGIVGATHLLKDDSLTREERNEMLQLIDDSIDYSNKIVSDLLDYSREVALSPVDVTLREVIRTAVKAVRVPETIQVQVQTLEQTVLNVDAEKLKRALINLIGNAVDAMPKGGTLTIGSKQSDGFVELVISDTGTGFDKAILANLWKPLQTTKSRGMGLGLPIAKRIVEAHEGNIAVVSTVGVGSTVTIRLPIKPFIELKQT